jgi:cytoskeletal protein RodZ
VTEQVHKLGEVLRTAREARGVDLTRVERDTKIRERYLSALERGEYRELPGAVYTKGFLRNYGSYLGLDPEYLIDLYRIEATSGGPDRIVSPAPPRPIAVRRSRSFAVTPAAVVGTILTLFVGTLIIVLTYQVLNFAQIPELRVIEPPGDVAAHRGDSITVRGSTAPNARVTVSGLRENPVVMADARGDFEVTVSLVPGSNVIELTAYDPVTDRDSVPVQRTVQVVADVAASATPSPAPLSVTQPAADATLGSPVALAGTGAPGSSLQVSAVLVTAATPSFAVTDPAGTAVTITPTAPSAPPPATVGTDAAGTFAGSLELAPGTWDISIAPATGDPVVRRVIVQPGAGLGGTLRLEGGPSYLEIDQDGVPLAAVSGSVAADGQSVALSATRDLRIRAGNAGAIRLTINGIDIGAMGGNGAVVEWRITRSGS